MSTEAVYKTEQGWNGWHKAGGTVFAFAVVTQIKAALAATPDGGADPYLTGLGIILTVLAGMLVFIGCERWAEYEDVEPVVSTEAVPVEREKIGA